MRKYYQLLLIIVCFISVVCLLIYRHEYYRLRYVLEVLNFFGKPGLTETEFCGPGYNVTLLTEMLKNSSLEVKESPAIFQQIDDNHYVFSTYLRPHKKKQQYNSYVSESIVIGNSKVTPNFKCHFWYDKVNKTPKAGKFYYEQIGPSYNGYSTYLFYCSLSRDVELPSGVSFYINNSELDPLQSPIFKLKTLEQRKDRMSSVQFIDSVDIVMCVLPNEIPYTSSEEIIQFLTYHVISGVHNYFIYDSTISEEVVRRLNLISRDISGWKLTFLTLNYPFSFSKAYKAIRKAVEMDCIYRNFNSKPSMSHQVTLSWDEFVVPRVNQNLNSFLAEYYLVEKQKNLLVPVQIFCSNQKDDPKINSNYPELLKKTHKYNIDGFNEQICVNYMKHLYNISDVMNTTNVKIAKGDLIAVHKYRKCLDKNSFSSANNVLNLTPHVFEGAMMKYSESIMNNKVYRMFKSGQLLEKSTEIIRDTL